jgi:hypothetical protein
MCNNTFIPGCGADLDRRENGGQSLRKAQSLQSSRLSFQSSELDPTTPSQGNVVIPHPSLGGGRVGGPNSDEGTDTLVLYVCILK